MTMKLKIIIFFLATYFLSCSNDNKSYIIGEWYKLDDWINTGFTSSIDSFNSSSTPPEYYPIGFEYNINDSVEYLMGIWDSIVDISRYKGRFARYKVVEDSLFLFYPNLTIRKQYKIEKHGQDTMRLIGIDGSCRTLIRFKSTILSNIRIDSIKIKVGNGWGKDEEYIAKSDGTIIFKDNSYIDTGFQNIYKIWKIDTESFKIIELKFLKSDFINLNDYLTTSVDGEGIETKIYWDKKEKRIFDSEHSSPMKFIWAYKYLMTVIDEKYYKEKQPHTRCNTP